MFRADPGAWLLAADNTETITYSEFVAFFSAASFVQFFVDADSDNSGSLSMLEFLKAIDESDDFDLSKYGMTAEQIFKEADEDGSDDLSFSEFAHAFKKLGLKED
jgi:Ca2+-binding EF-hand superfamily protein